MGVLTTPTAANRRTWKLKGLWRTTATAANRRPQPPHLVSCGRLLPQPDDPRPRIALPPVGFVADGMARKQRLHGAFKVACSVALPLGPLNKLPRCVIACTV